MTTESGHAVAARVLGNPLGGATINPDPNGKYGGLVWGPGYSVAYGDDNGGDRKYRTRTVLDIEGNRRAIGKDSDGAYLLGTALVAGSASMASTSALSLVTILPDEMLSANQEVTSSVTRTT